MFDKATLTLQVDPLIRMALAEDITAKKKADHIGWLTEDLYQETLWKHRPLTDFWQEFATSSAYLSASYG